MIIRRFALSDYSDVCGWWTAHKWAQVPLDHLPAYGFVVEHGGVKVCAGWLYQTDSKMGWIEWIISNPETEKEVRSAALDLLISGVLVCAEVLGIKTVFGSLKHQGLMKKYLEAGFIESDKDVTHFIKRLGG